MGCLIYSWLSPWNLPILTSTDKVSNSWNQQEILAGYELTTDLQFQDHKSEALTTTLHIYIKYMPKVTFTLNQMLQNQSCLKCLKGFFVQCSRHVILWSSQGPSFKVKVILLSVLISSALLDQSNKLLTMNTVRCTDQTLQKGLKSADRWADSKWYAQFILSMGTQNNICCYFWQKKPIKTKICTFGWAGVPLEVVSESTCLFFFFFFFFFFLLDCSASPPGPGVLSLDGAGVCECRQCNKHFTVC